MEIEEKSLKILAVQISSKIGDKLANFKKVEELVSNNITDEVDIIVLPEVWTVGWSCKDFRASAESLEKSETIEFLTKLAKKYDVNIIGGSFIRKADDGTFYNTCPVINREGKLVTTYDKMHLFSYYGCLEGEYVENGKNPVIVNFFPHLKEIASVESQDENSQLMSCNDAIKIGLSICYDIRFPEIYRAYAQSGADVLINMAAWPLGRAIHWEALTKARAIENQCFMIAVTQSGVIEGDEWNLGHSRIISYTGETIAELGVGDIQETSIEGTILAELKFHGINEFRKKCTVLLDIHKSYDVINFSK